MLKTLDTFTYGSIRESSYYAQYIGFLISVYYSSVSDKQLSAKDCRWNRIHSFLQKY